MEWLTKLKSMKKASKKTTKEISLESKIPEPTLEKLFSGASKDPKLSTVMAVVHCLGGTLDDLAPAKSVNGSANLSPTETAHLEKFRKLDDKDQDRTESYMDGLLSADKYQPVAKKSAI